MTSIAYQAYVRYAKMQCTVVKEEQMVQETFKPSMDRPTGGDTPLREFIGILEEYKAEEHQGNDGSKYTTVNFNFKELEVLDAVEPYPFPIAVIRIGYKPPKASRGGTKWDVLAGSLRKLAPKNPDPDLLVGKKQQWKMVESPLRGIIKDEAGQEMVNANGDKVWGEVPTLCWAIVSVDGLGSVEQKDKDFNVFLVDLADGKTEPQFYSAALTNSEVTARPNIVEAITDRKLLATLIEMGKLERDAEGILHKVLNAPVEETPA